MGAITIPALTGIDAGKAATLLVQFDAAAYSSAGLGNIMVQARAAGVVSSLAEMRRYIGRSIETKTYQPKK